MKRLLPWWLVGSLLATAGLVPTSTAWAMAKAFGQGSLIIPPDAAFQTDCGAIASYGLVYMTLFKNAARVAAGKKPITVYWLVNPDKKSHHRCNMNLGSASQTALPYYTAYNDNDGCDFYIGATVGTAPVALVDTSNAALPSVSPFNIYQMSYTASTGSVTRGAQSFAINSTITALKYGGGAFAIDASDAADFLSQLVTDPDLVRFKQSGCTCGGLPNTTCHSVEIHRAQNTFSAQVARIMNDKPPVIGLLGANTVTILQSYLNNAGLGTLPNACGCYPGSPACGCDGSASCGGVKAPNGCDGTNTLLTNHGIIYDVLDPVRDLVSNPTNPYGNLNAPENGKPDEWFYKLLWAPHWEAAKQSAFPVDGDLGDDVVGDKVWTHGGKDALANGLNNVAYFADTNHGIFAECASLESFEGSIQAGKINCSALQCQSGALTASPTCGSGVPTSSPNQCLDCGSATAVAGGAPACPSATDIVCPADGFCYSCPAGSTFNTTDCKCYTASTTSAGTAKGPPSCGGGNTLCLANSQCYSCKGGYTLNQLVCSATLTKACTKGATLGNSTGPIALSCPGGSTLCPANNTCYTCGGGATFSTADCLCHTGGTKLGANKTGSPACPLGQVAVSSQCYACSDASDPQLTCADVCPATYSLTGIAYTINPPADGSTQFQTTNSLFTNGLKAGAQVPDCTDNLSSQKTGDTSANAVVTYKSVGSGQCFDFHPENGSPGNPFAQRGSFPATNAGGHVHDYQPATGYGSMYRPAQIRFAGSWDTGNAANRNWDFFSAIRKDNDPNKGLVVYLAGHDYGNDPYGNRLVLNTMLNLAFTLQGTEIARSEPIAQVDYDKAGKVASVTMMQGTYLQMSDPGPHAEWLTFTPGLDNAWKFPYFPGHFRAYDEVAFASNATQDFVKNAVWDSAKLLPDPNVRKVFTAINGRGSVGTTASGVAAQWAMVKLDGTAANLSGGCVNVTGRADTCDLAEQLCVPGVSAPTDANSANTAMYNVQRLAYRVAGYCSSDSQCPAPVLNGPSTTCNPPSVDSQCSAPKVPWNSQLLGGIDHSTGAVVGSSKYVAGRYANRPVVAYAGGRDGMLHAFYVKDGLGFSADGATMPVLSSGTELWAFIPPGQLDNLATNSAMVDAAISVTDVFGDFPTDLNGDGIFDMRLGSLERPNGLRGYRTVLVATVGEGNVNGCNCVGTYCQGGEVFALDVTNPLKPVLLWDLSSVDDHDNYWDGNNDGTIDPANFWDWMWNTGSYAYKWSDWDDGIAWTPQIPVNYDDTSWWTLYLERTGRFNYADLGRTYGLATGRIADGQATRYVAFAATAAPLASKKKAIEVFSIDLVTGQKLWQWERVYQLSTAGGNVIADNSPPGRPALVDTDLDGTVDRVYVADLEGHIWELDARTGKNMNWVPLKTSGKRSFPLFGSDRMEATSADPATRAQFTAGATGLLAQQPLSAPMAVARFTDLKPEYAASIAGRISLVAASMGVDWVIAPYEAGKIFVVPAVPEGMDRLLPPIDPADLDWANTFGLLRLTNPPNNGKVDATHPQISVPTMVLAVGERLFGAPKVFQNQIFASTAFGNLGGDISSSRSDLGYFHRFDLSTQSDAAPAVATGKSQGGPLLVPNGAGGQDVIVAGAAGLTKVGGAGAAGPNGGSGLSRPSSAVLRDFRQLPPESVPYLK